MNKPLFTCIDVEYIYGFVWWGVSEQSRRRHSVTVRSKMADIRYYGNVMTTTRWLYVTMETLCQQQDGGYAFSTSSKIQP